MTDEPVAADAAPLPSLDAARAVIEAERKTRHENAVKALIQIQNDLRFDLVAFTYPDEGPGGSTIVNAAFRLELRA